MARPYRVTVVGDRETNLAFKKLGLKASDLSAVFGRIANDVANDGRVMVPKRSGVLAASIKAGRAKTRATVSAGGRAAPYAGPIEYGWVRHGITAQPFLRPAADTKADSSAEQIAREMRRLIDQCGLD